MLKYASDFNRKIKTEVQRISVFVLGKNLDLWVLKQKIKQKGGKIIGNRTRQFAYNFRASEQEKNLIDRAIAKSGLTMTAFVIRAITEKPITVIENGSEILAELKRQGNNLNQAVRGIYNGLATEEEIRNCIAELKQLYAKISIAIGGG